MMILDKIIFFALVWIAALNLHADIKGFNLLDLKMKFICGLSQVAIWSGIAVAACMLFLGI